MSLKPADYPFWLRVVIVLALAFFAVNAFFLIAPFATFAVNVREFFGPKEIITGIVGLIGTLFATFIGALLAFQFASRQKQKEKTENEVAAGNRALFILTAMYNQTFQHQKEIVDAYRDRPDAWLNLPATSPFGENLSFDIKDLSFLLLTNPVVFQNVVLEEFRFKLLSHYIADHRSLNLTTVWPRLEAAGVAMGGTNWDDYVKSAIGVSAVRQLTVTSKAIIQNTDQNLTSLKAAFSELRKALKKIYPGKPFINFNFEEPKKAPNPT